eukprot:g61789.t1
MDMVQRQELRLLQRKTYQAAWDCTENESLSPEQLQQCVSQAHNGLQEGQRVVTLENERFQFRLRRCMENCQDSMQDKVAESGPQIGFDQGNKLELEFNQCVGACYEAQIKNVGPMIGRIRAGLQRLLRQPNAKE